MPAPEDPAAGGEPRRPPVGLQRLQERADLGGEHPVAMALNESADLALRHAQRRHHVDAVGLHGDAQPPRAPAAAQRL